VNSTIVKNTTTISNITQNITSAIISTSPPPAIKTLATKTSSVATYSKLWSQPSALSTGQVNPGAVIIPIVIVGIILVILVMTFVISRLSNLRWIVIIKLVFCC
jgi:hypothetical protein